MRYAFALLILLHGLIHLLGFAKAFGARSLPLETTISKRLGLAWLGATVLMCSAAGLLLRGTGAWWLPAAPGVLLSQALVLAAFRDAKFGTLPNLIIAVAIAAGLLGHRLPGVGTNRYLGAGGDAAVLPPLPAPVQDPAAISGVTIASRPEGSPPTIGKSRSHPRFDSRPAEGDLQKGSSL